MSYLIGVDVGGTFTDFSCFDTQTSRLFYYKVSSTRDDPSQAIMIGLRELLNLYGIDPGDIAYLAHGTTVATNALIQRKGGKTGLITTKGFCDLLEIGRQTRPSLYELEEVNAPVLVPGKYRCEVTERLLSNGEEYTRLDEDEVRRAVHYMKENGVTAIAVCTLFSFVNPEHERRIEQIIKEEYPEAYVSVSSKVVPEFREYSRMSTTVVNAFLGPVMDEYVTNFQRSIESLGVGATPYITQSNGSIISIQEAKSNPVRTALSGPSAGIVAAQYITDLCGVRDAVTFDMGGTSADISLISKNDYRKSAERNIEGYVIRIPMIDIETVGAGGGSIAYVDAGGALKVGPQSAGAEPGPAAYDRGGTKPTVTDANVILGRLNPERILGGRMAIRRDLSEKAIKTEICDKTDLDLLNAAKGIIAVVNSNMVRTMRVVSVERGYDVREFALMAFGGAGPLHACEVARELGMHTIIIPPSPGTLCSLGLLVADVKYDYVKTAIMDADVDNIEKIAGIFDELEEQGREFLQKQKVPDENQQLVRQIDAHYKMQNYELIIPVDGGPITEQTIKKAVAAFHREHEKNYGYCNEKQPVQFVNFRLTAVGRREKPVLQLEKADAHDITPRQFRNVYFNEDTGFINCPIYQKDDLYEGYAVQGPAVIEQMDSTIVVMPDWCGRLDGHGILRMDYNEGADKCSTEK
mgnify:CR=1 FL=1